MKKVIKNLDMSYKVITFVIEKEIRKMTTSRKYEVGCSGSGWGVWDNETGRKIASFTGRSIGRIEALRYLYYLNGWDWNHSKYVRNEPWLKDFKIWEGYGIDMTN